MTAKEFLSQAYHLEQQINDKLEEVKRLEALATKATTVLGGNNTSSGAHDVHSREKLICSIIDTKQEVNREVEKLLAVKQEIRDSINALPDARQRIVLEKHYLCNKKWKLIASELGYSLENIYVLHRKALKKLKIPKSLH